MVMRGATWARAWCGWLAVLLLSGAAVASAPQPDLFDEAEAAQPGVIFMSDPPPPIGRDPNERTSFSGRLVTRHTFDDALENPEEVPREWFRAQHNPPERSRLGFPAFNRASFDRKMGASGSGSVVLPTRGGSTSLRLAAGAVVMFAEAQYRVTANVRTGGLRHARAYVRAVVLNEAKQPIPGSEMYSVPVLSEGEWTPVSVNMPTGLEHAAYLQIELQLLQPDQFPKGYGLAPANHDTSGRMPLEQDLSGQAWFDDVTVLQLPRVSISTDAPGNVFVVPADPAVTVRVRDLTGDSLTAEVTVTDLAGEVVDRRRLSIDPGGTTARLGFNLPRLGWYRVTMSLLGISDLPAEAAGLAETSLLYVDDVSAQRRGREESGPSITRPFGLVATNVPTDSLGQLPLIVSRVGLSRLTASFPTERGPTSPSPAAALEQLLDAIANQPIEFTLALSRVPRPIAEQFRVDPENPLTLVSVPATEWESMLKQELGPAGERVISWQIGPSFPPTPLDHDTYEPALAALRRSLATISGTSRITLPWQADSQWPKAVSAKRAASTAAIVLPVGFPDALLPLAMENFKGLPTEGVDLTYLIERLPAGQFSDADRLQQFMIRAITVWAEAYAANTQHPSVRVALADPWSVARDGSLRPEPALAAFATLARMTDGMRVIGQVPTTPGVTGLVLAPESGSAIGSLNIGGGLLIVWDHSGESATQSISGYFGGGTLTLVDVFGNRRDLAPNGPGGAHTIPVSREPTYVLGVDSHLVRFLSELRVEPDFIPAVVGSHDCEIVLRNPWSTRISGDLTLLAPDSRKGRRETGWALSPTTPMTFSIAPGGTARLPFSFLFASAEEAGTKQVPMLIRLAADRAYPNMRIGKPITIGLEDLEMSVSATLGPRDDGPDVIVTTAIRNTGRLTRTLQVTTTTAGFATQTQPVVDINAGESAIRRFVFRNGAEKLSGKRIRAMLVDVDGAERMTKYAEVP
jgi:hypothetical protein